MPRVSPQLALKLAAPPPDASTAWRDGACVTFLGSPLRLVLDTAARAAQHCGAELHLPLPPAAGPQQIRDAAESWLRDAALRHFRAVAEKSAPAGRRPPPVVLGFGKDGPWVQSVDGTLRCRWRLIEQAPEHIERVFRAILGEPQVPMSADLFAAG